MAIKEEQLESVRSASERDVTDLRRRLIAGTGTIETKLGARVADRKRGSVSHLHTCTDVCIYRCAWICVCKCDFVYITHMHTRP